MLVIRNVNVPLKAKTVVRLDVSERVRMGTLAYSRELTFVDGHVQEVPRGAVVYWDDQGKVERFEE